MKWTDVNDALPPRHARVNFCLPLLLTLDMGEDGDDPDDRYHVVFGVRWGIRERDAKFYSLDNNGRYPTDVHMLDYEDVTEYVIAWATFPAPFRRNDVP